MSDELDKNREPPRSGNHRLHISTAWLDWRRRVDLAEYDSRWDRLEAAGRSVHDEADLVDRLGGKDVLDAGCGTGRVAVELARRGLQVVGVDNDPDMLALARRKPAAVRWELGDLATVDLAQRFDTAVLAGDILAFVEPARRSLVVSNIARHLTVGGLMITGATIGHGCGIDQVDRWCDQAGLALDDQFASWDRQPFVDGGRYRVSIHRRVR